MFTCVPSFNLLGLTVPEKNMTKTFKAWKLKRKKTVEIKGQIRAAAWFRYTQYICSLSMCVAGFNLLGLTVPEKSVTKNFNVWKLERKKKEEIKGQISSSSLILIYTIHLPTVMCVPSFNFLGLSVPEKSVTKTLNVWKLESKKNEEINWWISRNSLILIYKIHPPIFHVCTKFQFCRPYSSWEKCDKYFSKKTFTNTHTNIFTEKTKTIYPLYTVLQIIFLAHLSQRLTRWTYRIGLEPASVCLSVNNFKHEYL